MIARSDWEALLQVILASLIGIGATVAFSVAILGAIRFAELRRDERATGALAGLAATLAAVAFGIYCDDGEAGPLAGECGLDCVWPGATLWLVTRIIFAGLTALAVLALAVPAQVTFPGQNGKVAWPAVSGTAGSERSTRMALTTR